MDETRKTVVCDTVVKNNAQPCGVIHVSPQLKWQVSKCFAPNERRITVLTYEAKINGE